MESSTEKLIKVHRVLAGPFTASDDPEWEEDEGEYFWLEATVEYDGEVLEMTIAHEDFEKIYAICKHMNSSTIEPYIIGKPYD